MTRLCGTCTACSSSTSSGTERLLVHVQVCLDHAALLGTYLKIQTDTHL